MKNIQHRIGNTRNSFAEYLLLPISIFLIWFAVLMCKKIYPFGSLSLVIGDGAEQILPAYTHVWDVLHGHKSLWFDWYTGLGDNMAGTVLEFALISPFNLFFLFVKRSAIESAMPFFILIKLEAMAFSMRFLLKRWFPDLSSRMRILFCIIYVFSPFNMSYYYVSRWSEMSVVFPLLMYGYFQLMNEGKKKIYIICLAIATMLSFQNIYMLLLMLFMLTGILPLLNSKKYKPQLGTLLGATFVGLMLSAWLWIPGGLQILRSYRVTSIRDVLDIWKSVWVFHPGKWMKLWNMSIPVSCFLLFGWKNHREKSARFFGGVLLLLCAPIILESTNILWHGGSYMGFTMRFSYMLAFWIIVAGAYALEQSVLEGAGYVNVIIGSVCAAFSIFCAGILYFYYINDNSPMKTYSMSFPIIIIVIISILSGVGLLRLKRTLYEAVTWIVVVVHSISLALISVYPASEISSNYIYMSNTVSENYEVQNNPLIRIKNTDAQLSHNYPIIMERYAASSFLPFNSQKQIEGMDSMGYAGVGVRTSDYGGTLVSDALLGIEQAISREKVSEELYQPIETYVGYTFYQSLYHYDQGIKIANPDMEIRQAENPFIYQNQLAEAVVGIPLLDIVAQSEGGGEKQPLRIEEESVLYVYADNAESFVSVAVEDANSGEKLEIELSDSGWMNGILELGVWENALLNIDIVSKEEVGAICYAVIPLQRFATYAPRTYDKFDVQKGFASLVISLQGASENDYLYLPVYPDEGWKCVVNDKEVTIQEFAQIAMAIPLQPGDNSIRMTFVPYGLLPGVVITFLGLIIFVMTCKIKGRKEYEKVNHILWIMDEVGFAAVILIIYVIPVFFLINELAVKII